MDLSRDSEFPSDLSPLAWVAEELRRSLESVHKALRRLLRDGDSRLSTIGFEIPGQPNQSLTQAASQLHQVAGVLGLVGLPAGAVLLRAAEAAVSRLAASPVMVDHFAVETIEKADFALMSLIAKMLAGAKPSTLSLFPPYRDLLDLVSAERIHPADLWQFDWAWRELPNSARPLGAEAARPAFEAALLKQMRQPNPAHAHDLSELCAGLAAGSSEHELRCLWQLAAAQFEAQAQGLLPQDAYVKRLGSRLLSQLRAARNHAVIDNHAEQLGRDLLFFCALAKASAGTPRLQAVRAAYQLGDESNGGIGNYEDDTLGRVDPSWVAQAKRRVSVVKESWSVTAEGETHRLAGLDEQFAAVADSLERLFPSGEVLGETLRRAIVATLRSGKPPEAKLAMEIATAILYIEAALEDAAFDQPEQAERVKHLASRIEAVAHGEPSEPLEAWMEELYRRVSDRQTLGSVVHELRHTLGDIEKRVDEYFRAPAQREVLIAVPGLLQSMRGVLKVLGLDQAALCALRMRDSIDELANTEVDATRPAVRDNFERMATNLGALGFLIDMLSVQPQLAKRMFAFDEFSGVLAPVMGRRADAEPVVALPELASEAALEPTLVLDFGLPAAPEPLAAPLVAPAPVLAAAPHGQAAAERVDEPVDAEMQEIFLEEAGEVIGNARNALAELETEPHDAAQLTIIRRAFHTLKGSARMVGLHDFGEGAWACEQLYNAWMASGRAAEPALQSFTAQALAYQADWCAAIASKAEKTHSSAGLRENADALRLGQAVPVSVAPPAGEPVPVSAPAPAAETGHAEILPEPVVEELHELPLEFPIELAGELAAERATELAPERLPAADEEGVGEAAAPLPHEAEITPDLLLSLDFGTPPGPVEEPTLVDAPLEPQRSAAPSQPAFELPSFELPLDLDATEAATAIEPRADMSEPAATQPAALGASAEAVAGADLSTFAPAPEALVSAPIDLVGEPSVDPAANDAQVEGVAEAESVKVIGDLRISITLFNIFLSEADEISRRLCTELAEWALQAEGPPGGEALAHALAGNAATVGYEELSQLARELEHALGRAQHDTQFGAPQAPLFSESADELRHLLHQFAAGFLKPANPELRQALHDYQPLDERDSTLSALHDFDDLTDAAPPVAAPLEPVGDFPFGVPDQIDAELFPIFEEEAQDLLHKLHSTMREWLARPHDLARADAPMRALHTFKGGARLCGAMRLGELAHRMESSVERLTQDGVAPPEALHALQEQADALEHGFEQLQREQRSPKPAAAPAVPVVPVVSAASATPATPVAEAPAAPAVEAAAPAADVTAQAVQASWPEPPAQAPLDEPTFAAELSSPSSAPSVSIDWSRFTNSVEIEADSVSPSYAQVRVRGLLLERMANQAGEVSIRRARLESELSQMRGSLHDLDDNLERMRTRLRELDLQAEAQMGSHEEASRSAGREFDSLEFDRYTRFQELTKMMAEAVNDVATVQRSLQRNVQLGEDELAAQSRLTRELQDDLLRTRLVEFESLAERMHRVVRQAARETGKQAKLDIVGGHIELDRSVMERMAGPFEHLLRNSLSHGIEAPEARVAAGKEAVGTLSVALRQEGNEIVLSFGDDGAGLNLARIRERGIAQGLIAADATVDEKTLMGLIFAPGFSTATEVTELAGRGVGMDVVRSEVNTLGGYIDIDSRPGQGARFDVHLPLTTAVTQIVQLRYGEQSVAVPAALMEGLQRVELAKVAAAYGAGQIELNGQQLPLYSLSALMGQGGRALLHGKYAAVVVVHSAHQRLALHVDEVLGNQEVVVKNLGTQLRHVPGLAGISLLANGDVALIYNPVALALHYGAAAQARVQAEAAGAALVVVEEELPPLVLVVDDSLTVRRVTQRLLEREGYRVELAKDGLEAMEKLAGEELPAVVLSDIEMPRMDGFDLVRNLRDDARLAGLPVIMITSRIAQKHRDYAGELGVDHYLGKPYDEEQLLGLIARYTAKVHA